MTDTSGAYLNTLRESATRDDLLREIERHIEEKAVLTDRGQRHDARVTELLEANNREVGRRRTAEARVAELEFRLGGAHEDIDTERTRAEKAEAEVARLRGTLEYIAAQAKAGYPTVLSAALDDKWQATVSAAMATLRPAPAQRGQSSAQPAAEPKQSPRCPICGNRGWVVGWVESIPAYHEPCPNGCGDATPLAAGSPAGKGEG